MNIKVAYQTAKLEASIVRDIQKITKTKTSNDAKRSIDETIELIDKLFPIYAANKQNQYPARALLKIRSSLRQMIPDYIDRTSPGFQAMIDEISKLNKGNYTREMYRDFLEDLVRAGFQPIPVMDELSSLY